LSLVSVLDSVFVELSEQSREDSRVIYKAAGHYMENSVKQIALYHDILGMFFV